VGIMVVGEGDALMMWHGHMGFLGAQAFRFLANWLVLLKELSS
jgi:hypothetical protein